MEIRSESVIDHPRERVFMTYRDRLPEVASYIPDIEAINELLRSRDGVISTVHNEWISDKEVPGVLSKFVKKRDLCWDDFAKWDDDGHRLDTRVFTEAVRCGGRNRFVAEGQSTRVIISGELDIDVERIRAIPKIVARRLKPRLEQFIVALVTPNLTEVNRSLQRFMDEH